ncbi:MAG: hypothetical protein FJZ97_12360 [Chloroflexi bacterium]|nr:hypothetical protein [Chloroflexota bacterium]
MLASTAPLFVIGALGPAPALTVEIDSQATLSLALPAQPAKVLVDGAEQPISYADGVLTIELPRGRHELRVE